MLIRAPRTSRELFELLRLLDPQQGLGKLLERLDTAHYTSRQAIYAVHGRLPGANGARPHADYNPRAHLRTLLQSEEFQKRLMPRLLDAYAEHKRLLFVHVPKCAGSDLTRSLKQLYPAFNFRLPDRAWFPTEKMLAALKLLVDDLAYGSDIFVHGHVPLATYMSAALVRGGDRCMAIARRPIDMVVSQINYILTRFSRDPELKAIDTRSWLNHIPHATVQAAIASGNYAAAAHDILHAPDLVPRDPICHFLGEGTAASAFDLCLRADIELTHVECYEDWLRLRWGVTESTRNNASLPLISLATLSQEDQLYAARLSPEDRVFVDRLEARLHQSGACFVMGSQLDG